MSIFSAGQIAGVARQAGFTGSSLVTAIAIALAESGGDTNAYNPETAAGTPWGSGSRGLWQIYGKAHPQYNSNKTYDPLTNARAAFSVSGGGYNFLPWSTYTNGDYLAKMAIARAAAGSVTGVPVTSGGAAPALQVHYVTPSLVPWVNFPRVDNLGGIEPFGGFPKPDTNIQIPALYPIAALLPGTVTALDGGNVAWGAVVTIRLDTPLNALATHMAYLHLNRSVVRVGQHVSAGQLIAYNGYSAAAGSQKVPLGVALYNGPHYGNGPAWALMTKENLQGLLNPVPFILLAQQGRLAINDANANGIGQAVTNLTNFINGTTTTTVIMNAGATAHEIINNTPGFTGICNAVDASMQFVAFSLPAKAASDLSKATQPNTGPDVTIWDWITNPTVAAVTTAGAAQGAVNAAQAAIQLPADGIQAALVFATTNILAFVIRGTFVVLGIILFFALMTNLASTFVSASDVAGGIKTVATLAA